MSDMTLPGFLHPHKKEALAKLSGGKSTKRRYIKPADPAEGKGLLAALAYRMNDARIQNHFEHLKQSQVAQNRRS